MTTPLPAMTPCPSPTSSLEIHGQNPYSGTGKKSSRQQWSLMPHLASEKHYRFPKPGQLLSVERLPERSSARLVQPLTTQPLPALAVQSTSHNFYERIWRLTDNLNLEVPTLAWLPTVRQIYRLLVRQREPPQLMSPSTARAPVPRLAP